MAHIGRESGIGSAHTFLTIINLGAGHPATLDDFPYI